MKRHLSLLTEYFLQYSKVRLAYRGDFLISVVTTLVATVFGIAVVWLIFGRVPKVHGWSFYEILSRFCSFTASRWCRWRSSIC